MAAIGLSRCAIWLARGVPDLGRAAYRDRAALEPVADPASAAPGPGRRGGGGEFAGAAWCHGDPCFRVCGDLVCHRRHGCASAAPPRNRRGQHHGGDCGRRSGRTGAGCGAARGIRGATDGASAALLHPIGAVILGLLGPGAITAFAVLHGAGNGLLTIAKGTVPLAIFGPVGYGLRSGILGAPARATQAASPLLFGLLMDEMGIGVLAISAGIRLAALLALMALKAGATTAAMPA